MPIAVATELISYGKAPEMDVALDLWLSAIYKDSQVLGSEVGPVAYLRNGTGNPLLNYSDLAQRWGLSRSTVGRLLKKLADLDYLTLMSFPGRTYYRRRKEAIEALSSVLWGYTAQDSLQVLEQFFPAEAGGR